MTLLTFEEILKKYFMSYCPLNFWAFLNYQQNISKTVGARGLKLNE